MRRWLQRGAPAGVGSGGREREPQRVEEGTRRSYVVAPGHDEHAPDVGHAAAQVGEQPGLPDAGLALHEHEAAGTAGTAGDPVGQGAQEVGASEALRPAQSHPATPVPARAKETMVADAGTGAGARS